MSVRPGRALVVNNRRSQGVWPPACGIPPPLALSIIRTESLSRKDTAPGVWSRRTVGPQWLGCGFGSNPIVPCVTSSPHAPSRSAEVPAPPSHRRMLLTAVARAPAPTGRHSPKGEEERDADQRSAGTQYCGRKAFKSKGKEGRNPRATESGAGAAGRRSAKGGGLQPSQPPQLELSEAGLYRDAWGFGREVPRGARTGSFSGVRGGGAARGGGGLFPSSCPVRGAASLSPTPCGAQPGRLCVLWSGRRGATTHSQVSVVRGHKLVLSNSRASLHFCVCLSLFRLPRNLSASCSPVLRSVALTEPSGTSCFPNSPGRRRGARCLDARLPPEGIRGWGSDDRQGRFRGRSLG
ncbi:uncharacterized protein LOC128626286 [Artibeus jamaicensis]|uniref:uncharacterized protein LOC128626286 n=1 Tax=Artibeus jamaicensis TaxID=9417 RepID=UPI00235B042A|nr:uncharacterized protein LOC128626286 [Artibeus jamaicensis]